MAIWPALLVLFWQVGLTPAYPPRGTGPTLRITSPVGRSATSGSIRIVAQIQPQPEVPLGPVQFFVDGKLLQTDADGAPYAVEWTDANPFERCEIAVAVSDALGSEARDTVVLEPLDIVEEADVTSVLVEASVQDRTGRFVKNIAPSSFSVLEDGQPQVLDLARHEAVGAVFALLVDSSASMARRLDVVQRTSETLARGMGPLDSTIVAPFSKGLLTVTGPTSDRARVAEAIGGIRSQGGTAILDSLVQLAHRLPESAARRAVILITDGYDENSVITADEAIVALKEARTTVYVVAIGGVAGISLKGERVLRELAAQTGGRLFMPASEGQLQAVQVALADDVRNRYLLTYTPTNQKKDGTWREISVNVADPGYRVKARPGYFAPRPAPIRAEIDFTATDAAGTYLDVSASDLELLEDGVAQRVDAFHEASQPVSIALVLDASGSMRRREADVIASAGAFAAALRPEDRVAVSLFADSVTVVHDFSTNRQGTLDAINGYQASGGTALYDAMSEAIARLQTAEGRRVVVLMTDGRDENGAGTGPGSGRTLEQVLEQIKSSGTTVFAIGLGPSVDVRPLEEFAELSGGRALLPGDTTQLREEFQRVVEDLRRRYVVGYTSTNSQRDGQWRSVEIRLKSARQVTVRSAGGYFAPAR